MSAASTPAPSRSSGASTGSRHTLFWPMLVLLIGIGSYAVYQVMSLEDQLDSTTQAIDQMDAKVKRGQYERAKFYSVTRDILNLAPVDAGAEKIADQFRLRQLEAATPGVQDQTSETNAARVNPSQPATTNLAPAANTNSVSK